jgi:polysaccharide deacetylase family sporulation protein PdaB
MNIFVVINGKRLKQRLVLLLGVIFAVGVIYAERTNITVFQSEETPAAVYKVVTERKVLSLTFDISWGEQRVGPILDILQQKKVQKATFFLSAPWAESHPEIVRRILDAGFEIGSHGYKHANYSRFKDDEIRTQIRTAHAALTKVTGMSPRLIRMPNGDYDQRVLRIAHELGYRTIQWDTDSKDWTNPGTQSIIQSVITGAHPGDIVLLHASDSVKQTHEALPVIIDELRSRGYTFATVTELIQGTEFDANKAQEQTPSTRGFAPVPSET